MTTAVMVSMISGAPICKLTLEDINKALREKPRLSVIEAKNRLLEQIKDFAHLFADSEDTDDLPPFRGHIYQAINLRNENGKPLTPPLGPLYNMSKKELLVLRKTLTDL